MKSLQPRLNAVAWESSQCVLVDQRLLPEEETYLKLSDSRSVCEAITNLTVRGAPAIGVAGAYAVCLAVKEALSQKDSVREEFFSKALERISNARPTAVNLSWAVEKMRAVIDLNEASVFETAVKAAKEIHAQDIASNQKIAQLGSELIKPGKVITYCNTGDLATGGVGTAFGVVRQAFEMGSVEHVFACETRPVGQGLRLTAYELKKNKISFSLICDNMAASVLEKEPITAIVVGADRIAANGDVANKIGTLGLSVLAESFGVPLIVAAPTSTFDLALESGKGIPIEERSPDEILGKFAGKLDFPVYNPAFDVTPAERVSFIVSERGIVERPTAEKIATLLN